MESLFFCLGGEVMKKFIFRISLIVASIVVLAVAALFTAEYLHLYYREPEPIGDLSYTWDTSLDMETSYDNITAWCEHEEYPPDVERVTYFIQNNNPGKSFWIHPDSIVERKTWYGWKRIQNLSNTESSWGLASVKNEDDCYKLTRYFFPKQYVKKLKAGDYRIIVFVGNNRLYTNFKIVKEQ